MITLVVLYHVAQRFRPDSSTHTNTAGLYSYAILDFAVLIGSSQWPMYVFFTLAGFASCFSLRSRSVMLYFKDRTYRLVPSVLFGVLVLNPLSVWAFLTVFPEFGYDSLAEVYAAFWPNCIMDGNDSCTGSSVIGTYWYLLYLYTYCVLLIPVMLLWHRFSPPNLKGKSATMAMLVFFAVLFPLFQVALQVGWIVIEEAPVVIVFIHMNWFQFLSFFLLGFFLAWCPTATEILYRSHLFFLGSGLALTVVMVLADCSALQDSLGEWLDFPRLYLITTFAAFLFYGVWCAAQESLYRLPKPIGKVFDYVANRAIAVYVLHVPVMKLLECALYYILAGSIFDQNVYMRYILEVVLVYALCFGLYETLFRYKYTKFLVGMARPEVPKK